MSGFDNKQQVVIRVGYEQEIEALSRCGGKVRILIAEGHDLAGIELTKQQARKFAKQILEMTGDEDE